MTGSAEVKTALALARTMRRPAGSLLALLDRLDRLTLDARALPDFMATDPAHALEALLSAPPAAASDQSVTRARSGATGPSPRPASVRPVSQSSASALRPTTAPAGVVEAARAGAERVQTDATAARQRLRPSDVRAMRDTLRRDTAPPTPGSRRRTGTTDATESLLGTASPALPTPLNRPSTDMPDALAPTATARAEAASPPGRFRPPPAVAAPDALAGINDGIDPAEFAALGLVPRANSDPLAHGTRTPRALDSVPRASAASTGDEPALPGQTSARAADPTARPAPPTVRRPVIPAPIASPRAAIDAVAARRTALRLADRDNELEEASWRAGIDQP